MKTTNIYTFLGIALCTIATTFAQEANRPASNYAAQRAADLQEVNSSETRISPQQVNGTTSKSSKAAGAAQLINYQGVARDGSGDLLINQSIDVGVDLVDGSGGTSFFTELHNVTTDAAGVFSIQVGSINSLAGANWADVEPWLNVRVNGTSVGETQVGSSPSTLYSEQSSQVRMFGSGTSNPDKMIVQHSDGFPSWGIGYSDDEDKVDFMAGGDKNVRVDLFNGAIEMTGDLSTDGNVEVNETTTAPAANTLYGNTMPVAYGAMFDNATISSGYGITSAVQNALGVYEITIDLPTNSATPVVMITPFSSSAGGPEFIGYDVVNSNTFIVRVWDTAGNPKNSAFSFVVFPQ
ncbi:hypothetical protein GCM10009117_23470 [Gangjinia marincola]|uniref:Uncharacterized protein n=1 Tax=Gangjinia marincola TaxID=578463 RepID=A0ABP3XUV4_9FLAO